MDAAMPETNAEKMTRIDFSVPTPLLRDAEELAQLIISYETWLTDDIFGVLESRFVRTTFQGTLSRTVISYHFDPCVVPAFA